MLLYINLTCYGKISFFFVCSLVSKRFQANLQKYFFSEILTYSTAGVLEKGLLFPEKCCILTRICPIWRLEEHGID